MILKITMLLSTLSSLMSIIEIPFTKTQGNAVFVKMLCSGLIRGLMKTPSNKRHPPTYAKLSSQYIFGGFFWCVFRRYFLNSYFAFYFLHIALECVLFLFFGVH